MTDGAATGTGDPAAGRPVRVGPRVDSEHALTRTQSLIWASQRLRPDTPLANMGDRIRIAGALDPDRLVAAFDLVVRRSDVLRTVVATDAAGTPHARVLHEPPAATEVVDLPLGELDDWSARRIATPIDATRRVYDSVLLRHADDDWTWWIDVHHVAIDAWGAVLLFEATATAYEQLADRPAADVDLHDVVDGAYYERAAALAAASARAGVTSDGATDDPWAPERIAAAAQQALAPYGRRGARTADVDRIEVPLDDADHAAIEAALGGDYRALSRELSLLALSGAALMVLAHRLEGRDRLVAGVPVHHRSRKEASRVLGPLMELYPLELSVEPGETCRELFTRTLRSVIGVLRRARPGAGPDVGFEVVLNVMTGRYGRFAGMPAERTWMRSGTVEPNHPVRVQIYDRSPDGDPEHREVGFELDLNTALSADGAHRRMPDHLASVVRAMVADPGATVDAVPIVGHDEATELGRLNPDPHARPLDRPVHEQIREVLRRDPGRVVADHDGAELTAGELDRRADALARRLVDQGLERGRAVGVRMSRGLDVLVAVQGVLRAGGSFVLLDPADPRARHDAIADDADLFDVLDELPAEAAADAPGTGDAVAVEVGLDDPAYVLYTSGSTGAPKGVPIPHRGLADYLAFAVEAYVDDEPPVVALHSSLVFDLTITSLFLPLVAGGRTIVFHDEPVEALARIAADDRVTFLKATPTQLEIYTRFVRSPRPLRTIVVGGEAFRRPVAERTAASCRPGVRIFNEYGPTEAVVGCMIHEWDPAADTGPDVPIGAAAPGTQLVVLDAAGAPAPSGTWGELWVRRPGMAAGYLHLPELTAERFVELDDGVLGAALGHEPTLSGPWYRTGDRVRVERPGVLVFGGRGDDQVKVGGIRLEPGEVEAALVAHPGVENALVRLWQAGPAAEAEVRRCVRCGLGVDVPGVELDVAGVCSVCHRFDAVEPQTRRWFRTDDDLAERLHAARERRRGEIDCLHLLSGGKDSTYALYQLVERGWRVHALTLDNGYISDGAKENIRRSVADLGITHEFATTPAMREIFRDSLERYSNVCQGCYKTIYTLAVARAHELGIPCIVTGLSRGQFFETRLVPHQFEAGRFDPDEIDRTVLEARKVYHHTRDAVTELLPEQRVFDDDAVFDEIEFVDFYRYVDVELADMYRFLEERAPWVRPADTGRSTNCLINVAGIHVHQLEQGFHNYAEPYSWDVRLGHKRRDEALEELDDRIDPAEVTGLLDEIGYQPKSQGVLTAWYRSTDGRDLDPDELRAHLRERLPEHAVPAAFVRVDEVPLAASAKADPSLLPAPTRFHRRGGARVEPAGPTEEQLAELWAEVLGLEAVGATDDFFDLGGASLDALEVVARIDARFGTDLHDAAVFRHRTVRELATVVDDAVGGDAGGDDVGGGDVAAGAPAVGAAPERLPADLPPPLSAGEEAMLFDYRAAPADTRYNVTRLYTLTGDVDAIDLGRFEDAVRDVVMLHGPLHTSYDAGRRRLPRGAAATVVVLPDGSPASFDEFADRQRRVPFDLDDGPLVRVHLCRIGADRLGVLIGMHHISVDAGTFDTFWSQVADRYAGAELPTPAFSYADHTDWQRRRPTAASATFWRERAEAREATRPLGFARPAPPVPDGYLNRALDVDVDRFRSFGTTPFATALAAAGVVLRTFTGAERVELGVTASTRDHPDATPLVGYYLNTLPIELTVRDEHSFARVCDRVSDDVAEVLAHRTHPFASIVRDARAAGLPVPDVSYMLAYERLATPRFPGVDARQRILASGTSVSDVTFFVQERDDGIRLGLEYRGAVIDEASATRLLDAFAAVLRDGIAAPSRSVGGLLPDAGSGDLAGPALEVPAPTVLHRWLDLVRTRPDAPAVTDAAGCTLTYGQLAGRVDRLATDLAARGPARVGVSVARSCDLVVAMLAAQVAGAAYVPLDPTVPAGRLALIAGRADLDVVVVDDPARDVGVSVERVLVSVDDASEAASSGVADLAATVDRLAAHVDAIDPASTAYVIFTSGSTGVPRGVAVSHANLAASTAARDRWYPRPPARFLVTSSPGFDSSIVGLVWPLVTGGTVVVPGDDDVHDVDRVAALVAELGVTHTLTVPSLARALLDRAPHRLAGLETSIVAGESCPASLVDLHHRLLPHVALVNEYGPTEATVWATAQRLDPGADTVPIGAPIAGMVARVVDETDRPVPAGVAGELLLAGPGVTAGYLDDAAATAARFVEIDGRRWYRTGDLVRADGGVLFFVGRTDEQLNVGGNRIEPGEIEVLLRSIDGVRDAGVLAVGDPPMIVAHVEADRLDDADLRRRLAASVAPAAIPRRFVRHDALPRTVHGKLDRRALAEHATFGSGRAEPETTVVASAVEAVLDAWRTALDWAEVGPHSDFFELGGDSITAVEIVTAVGEARGETVPIAALLSGRTPAGMAALLDPVGSGASDVPTHAADDGVDVLRVRPGRPDGPVVVMTPAWDDVFGYQALAESFGDSAEVLALVYHEVPGRPVIGRVDDLVDRFERLVADRVDGARPVVVLGWSVGGVVAVELAARLNAARRRVDGLVLIDTFFPGEERHLWSNRWWKYKSLLRPGAFSEAVRELRIMAGRRVRRYAARAGAALLAWAGTPLPEEPERTSLGGFPVEAFTHVPTPPGVPMWFVAASTTNPKRTIDRWRELVDDVEWIVVPGRHRGFDSIMAADKVGRIAAEIERRLADGPSR